MKTKLIIMYWLASFALLTCIAEDVVIAVILTANFGYASYLMSKYEKEVYKAVDQFETKVMKLLKLN